MTLRVIISGLIAALILCIPVTVRAFDLPWQWAYGFFFALLGNGLECFITFFHEIGHALTGWFYGAPTIPMFDFVHGGGWAYMPVGYQTPVLVVVWGLMAYAIAYPLRGYGWLRIGLCILLLLNVATAFTDWRDNIFDFMGPGFEPLVGAFFLIRALYDLAPRRSAERFMNALFGFAIPIHALIMGWALLHNAGMRHEYWTQKDAQGSGDFDKIADRIMVGDFNGIVLAWMGFSVLCLVLPFILFAWTSFREARNF